MTFESLSFPVIIIFVCTTLVMLLSLDWRASLIALGFQYAGVFVLVGNTWPLEMALIKLATGIIVCSLLAIELVKVPDDQSPLFKVQGEPLTPSDRIFRVFLAIIFGLAVYSLAPNAAKWILNASYYQILASLYLCGMGILILGITNRPFLVVVGLLTFLSGFEIIFATLETSPLIAGFFSFLSFGIALLGTYILASQKIKVES